MKKLTGICLVLVLLVFSLSGCSNTPPAQGELPRLQSQAHLKKLLENQWNGLYRGPRFGLDAMPEAGRTDGAGDYSGTNVQVEGVGEADVIVTDGKYVYQATEQGVVIAQVWPVTQMKMVKTLETGFTPSFLYIDNTRLVVIGHHYTHGDSGGGFRIMPVNFGITKIAVYNITDKTKITLERELELEGYLVSSRKIDNALYLVTSSWLWGEANIPGYRDSALGRRVQPGYQDIAYFPRGSADSFVQLTAVDLSQPAKAAQVQTLVGSAQHIYMSRENLFIATTDWQDTFIYRFRAEGASLQYTGDGKVSGVPLNQFSMDEYQGYFRIATTSFQENLTNSLFVLDSELKVAGKITNIAPGERIYSARFMGDKGYMVTFETVDPLFVIDLSNPRRPKILGELKIPGFSTYLHPLDENHLLGIGRDTQVINSYDREIVIELGIKLAIFDVSDVNNPKERHTLSLGGRGTWSEALYDHRAVMFFRGTLAFPLTLMDLQEPWGWGTPDFVGAICYQVDIEKGFRETGRVSHLKSGEKNLEYWSWPHDELIRRVVQVEDVIFTISPSEIRAHQASDLGHLKSLSLR